MVIGRLSIEEGRAAGDYSLNLIQGLGNAATPTQVRDLWLEAKKHKVLFSDYTDGELEPFLQLFLSPRSVFFEVRKEDDDRPVGLLYVDHITPRFDARGHIAFWDKVARGREPIVRLALGYVMGKFNLRRVSAEVPAYQKGTIRFVKRLGFMEEGVRRKSVIYKGKWADEVLFGMLREELVNERNE